MIFPVPVKTVIITRAYSTSILNSIAIELASDAPFNVIENIKASTNDIATGSLMHPDMTVINFLYMLLKTQKNGVIRMNI